MANILSTTVDAVPVSFQALRDATRKCNVLQQVTKYILEGWPADPKQVAADVKPYFNRRESLSVINDCVMFQERVIVPQEFRRRLLNQFHRGHPGMVRMKTIARSYVFWPGMDGEIEDFVRRCNHCAIAAKAPIKAVPESWPTPDKPWSRIHIDYAGPVDGYYLLVVVDPFTRWPEVKLTKSTTTKTTIRFLKQMFSTFGIPETIVSDNGSQFTSYNFKKFCESLGIRHIRTAPYHPQSNGLAERFVDTVKRSLKKIRSGGESLEEALETFLIVYRSTPTSDLDGKSPAEKMMGRPMRTVSALLKPPVSNQQQSNQKDDPQPRCFKPGDAVHAQVHHANSWSWVPGVIIERIGKVNYNVLLDETRRLIRSHTNQLRSRIVAEVQSCTESPLTVFLDEFGLQREPNVDDAVIPEAPALEDPPAGHEEVQGIPPLPVEVPPLPTFEEQQPLDAADHGC